MLSIAKLVDTVLGKLPFDGDKTVLGLGLSYVLPLLVPLVAAHPAALAVVGLTDAVAKFFIAAGLLHKQAKAYIDYRDRKEVKELLEQLNKERAEKNEMY